MTVVSSRRASRARPTSFRGFGRAFEVLVEWPSASASARAITGRGGDRQKPQSETAGRVLHPTADEGTGKACEIAYRVDRRDPRRDRRASEERRPARSRRSAAQRMRRTRRWSAQSIFT